VSVPYSTCASAASSVDQDTVAPVALTLEAETPLITGAVVSGGAAVVNVRSAEVARLPAASRLLTR
jgi:hypothetical protein